ncbi:Outer membrane protein beta-barrel domain-containing protein [Lishizhenia tianjinensis]|uniref:Outer membrane protein beta-barrel domain-containing protein n=1 Tax=Lishizhenia tianjinensis TaxID=477690 RepID=A0A1I6ZKE5_9FLAO|nr:outer membrane beta-barrel protein [Lishizhenia tianjinensis]SFT63168.1 Outer membrane protein beta-barrel domain-containing protein [Lishizhenia tianjinensis]
MKKFIVIAILSVLGGAAFAQEDPDTLTVKIGNKVIIIKSGENEEVVIQTDENDSTEQVDINEDDFEFSNKKRKSEANWSGLEVGVNTFVNSSYQPDFPNAQFLEIDPSKSWNWNLNFMDGKLDIIRGYVGITSGLGLNVTNFSFRNNYIYNYSPNQITAEMDTLADYSKNKLRMTYITVPLLLEFTTNREDDDNFYFNAGIVGGVKLISKLKRETDTDGYQRKFSEKGDYGVNAFKADAIVRVGYGSWGVYASYNLLPTFDKDLIDQANQVSFGLSYQF